VLLTLKENSKLRVCVNHKVLNKVTKKDWYPLPFCEEILENNSRARNVHIWRWVHGLPPNENCSRRSIENHIQHTMGNILLHNNVFWFVQCSRDISTFDEQGFWTIIGPFSMNFHWWLWSL
jgi:hypothetical protein